MKIGAIILAAGQSRRMGKPKLLLPIRGRTLIDKVVEEILASAVDHVVVVVSPEQEKVQKELSKHHVVLVVNPDPEGEMLSSVRCGIEALPAGCEAAMIVLGDQPGMRASLVPQLMARFRETGGIVVPTHRGRRGHPTLLASKYFDEVLEQFDDVGLRGLLQAHPEEVHELEIDDPAALDDMDHPGDYERELGR